MTDFCRKQSTRLCADHICGVSELYFYLGKAGDLNRGETIQAVVKTDALGLPFITGRYLTLKKSPNGASASDFVGLSVSPDSQYESAIQEMIDELGVRRLLVRIPSWDLANLYNQQTR